ncbi:MAG: hypothetical protein QME16_00030 [Planctomycetota bacterium]|nr:hypothetical protein [Planctomycetota bacterium]
MNGNLMGKRFIFATIMGICVSVVTVILKYQAPEYTRMVLALAGIFVAGQSWTDIKEKEKEEVK